MAEPISGGSVPPKSGDQERSKKLGIKPTNLRCIAVVLAVSDTSTGTRELNVSALQYLQVAHRILVFELATNDVAEYLHFTVTMSAKPLVRFHAVFVYDAQFAE